LFFGMTTCVCASAASGAASIIRAIAHADTKRVRLLFDNIFIPSERRL
jgi:hypothetical protein